MDKANIAKMRLAESKLSHAYLRESFDYDEASGALSWKRSGPGLPRVGHRAGCLMSTGYRRVKFEGRLYPEHRLVWFWVHGTWPAIFIDHINGVRDDNRLCNLREVDEQMNQHNKRKAQRSSKTGVLGAKLNRTKTGYETKIQVNGVRIYLGTYKTAEEAHAVYVAAKRQHHEGCTL